MKKLMMALAAVAMVNAANAIATWEFSGVSNPDYGYALVFGEGEEEQIAQCFEEYIDTGDKSYYEEAVKTINGGTHEIVSISNGSGSGTYGFIDGDKVGIVFLDSYTAPTRYMIVENELYEGECLNFDMSGSEWIPLSTVPEPTSGMLMLLGLAGLALKRRR